MPTQFNTEYTKKIDGKDVHVGPLAALESSGYNLNSFTYPIDLTADPGEQHFVVFYINETTNTQFKTNGKDGELMGDQSASPSGESVRGSSSSSGPAVSQGDNISTWTKRPIHRVSTAIALYMPPSIGTTYSPQWEEVNGGTLFGAAKAFSEGNIARMVSEIGVGVASDFLKDAKDLLGGAELEAGASIALRAARNPHLEMLFRSIGFREYSFDFKFTPRSEQEAINVANIIKAFKFYASPEIRDAENWPRYYIYPAEFDIEFWSNGRQNDFLNKISTCACTGVSVNYTASGGWSSFRPGDMNGVPVETNLSLQFKELEVITKNRVLQGY